MTTKTERGDSRLPVSGHGTFHGVQDAYDSIPPSMIQDLAAPYRTKAELHDAILTGIAQARGGHVVSAGDLFADC